MVVHVVCSKLFLGTRVQVNAHNSDGSRLVLPNFLRGDHVHAIIEAINDRRLCIPKMK